MYNFNTPIKINYNYNCISGPKLNPPIGFIENWSDSDSFENH